MHVSCSFINILKENAFWENCISNTHPLSLSYCVTGMVFSVLTVNRIWNGQVGTDLEWLKDIKRL